MIYFLAVSRLPHTSYHVYSGRKISYNKFCHMMLNESPVPMFLYALPSHHIEISSDIYIYDISPHILDTTGTLTLSASNFKMICVINLIVEADRFN